MRLVHSANEVGSVLSKLKVISFRVLMEYYLCYLYRYRNTKYMNIQKRIVVGAVIVAVLMGAWFMFAPSATNKSGELNTSSAPEEGALDVVNEFYGAWLAAVQSTTTDPYQAGLSTGVLLSDSVQAYIADAQQNDEELNRDPVLCVSSVPSRVGARSIFISDTSAEVQVLGRGSEEKTSEYAVVSLTAVDGMWQVSDIACMSGETAPEQEFPFDREGFLLKGVPPQMDPNFWYLVYEENGKAGHVAPLTFDAESVCISPDGSERVCDPSQFVNPSQARVQGGMTEAGAVVQRVQMFEVE
jgi:hypothetical protein